MQDSNGKDRIGQDRTGQERTEQSRRHQDKSGQKWTGMEWIGLERTLIIIILTKWQTEPEKKTKCTYSNNNNKGVLWKATALKRSTEWQFSRSTNAHKCIYKRLDLYQLAEKIVITASLTLLQFFNLCS